MFTPVLPIIHLNGTSAKELLDLREDFYVALNAAIDKLKEMAPHGRDYYLAPGLMEQALMQHKNRLKVLTDLMAEISAECDGLTAQETKRQ